ncbi:MAG: cellulase family glycosylhydrolase [Solirubrobacteraceae bacterium]
MPKAPISLPKARRPHFLTLLLLVAVALAVSAPSALASRNQTVFFEAGKVLIEPHKREHAFQQMEHLGVHALRVELYWSYVAPSSGSRKRPKFEATNPGAYNWSLYDWVLGKAKELKWPVLLTVTSPVPKWASANHTSLGSPNAKDFEEFMVAVAKHYGSEVSLFAIWNEPNDIASLQPQFNSAGQPVSPRIYRALYQAGYAGLQAAGIAHPKVLMGEAAPFGYDSLTRSEIRRDGLLHDVAPLAFLRGALCLNSHYKKAGGCGSAPPAYGYAIHAYTQKQGPLWVPSEQDDVTIGTLYRLENALNRAARAGAISSGIPIYVTEFGVQSVPNRYEGVSLAKQAEYDALAEYIAWKNPRVAAFSQYLLHDDPTGGPPGSGVHGGTVGFQTGLEKVNGSPKPLYSAWPIPLVVSKLGHGYSLWGLVRPATGSTKVTILVKARGAKKYRVLKTATTESLGYWSFVSSTAGVSWKVSWTSPTGAKYEGPAIGATPAP